MKNIREIQYENAMTSYVNMLRLYSESPSMNTVERILANIEYNTTRLPMCGNYRLEPYITINDRYLNSELELIRADSNTITEYLSHTERYLRTIEYVASIWCEFAKKMVLRAREGLFSYTSDVITAATKLLNIQDSMDPTVTTMMYQNGLVVPNQTAATCSYSIFVDSDISIKPTSSSSINTITGTKSTVFNPAEYGSLILDAEMNTIDECGFIIETRKTIEQVNSMIVEFISNTKGIRILVDISNDGRTFTNIYNKVCWDVLAVIPFGSTINLEAIRITITANVPSVVSDSSVLFEFKLHRISFINIKNSISNVFQTKRIELDDEVKLVSPVIDGDISNATVNVKISSDADDAGNAVGFISVASLPGGVMRLENKASTLILTTDNTTWSMVPDSNYSTPLYNILGAINTETVSNSDYSVETGQIKFNAATDYIIPESVTLKRGVRDYLKTEMFITTEHNVTDLLHTTEYVVSTKWFKPIDLKVLWTEIITPDQITSTASAKNNAIIVSYYVANTDQFTIRKEDGTELVPIINAITRQTSGAYLIEFAAGPGISILSPGSNYHVTYLTTIQEIYTRSDSSIEIDLNSMFVSISGSQLSYGSDFIVNKDLWKLVLVKTGQYSQFIDIDTTDSNNLINLSPDIVVSFKYMMTPKNPVYKYSTYISCSAETDIVVKPFSPDEISMGNFHKINGTDVSQLISFTLPIGESFIETTNPYSTCNVYDLNSITQSACSAAIIIPENIDKMYAYRDNLRQVSTFVLGTLNKNDGGKCFAIDTNRILINFQPDFADPVAFNDETQSAQNGYFFTCKRPGYDSSYINHNYISQPEIFELSFSYKSDSKRYVAIRIDVECDSPDSYVSISKIGLNMLKED